MTPMEVWSLISPVIPKPKQNEVGYSEWIDVYTTVFVALKELEINNAKKGKMQ